jgi:hypothetical protein
MDAPGYPGNGVLHDIFLQHSINRILVRGNPDVTGVIYYRDHTE